MKALTLLLFFIVLICIAQAQTPTPVSSQPDIAITKFSWREVKHSQLNSARQRERIRNTEINRRIGEVIQDTPADSAEIERLEALRKKQITHINLPNASGKEYEYKVHVKNTGAKVMTNLTWTYVFVDPASQKEIRQYIFQSKVKIDPGKEKKLLAFGDFPPPRVASIKGMSKNNEQAWIEKVNITRIEYSDKSVWQHP